MTDAAKIMAYLAKKEKNRAERKAAMPKGVTVSFPSVIVNRDNENFTINLNKHDVFSVDGASVRFTKTSNTYVDCGSALSAQALKETIDEAIQFAPKRAKDDGEHILEMEM